MPAQTVTAKKPAGKQQPIPPKYTDLDCIQKGFAPPHASRLRLFLHGPVGQGKSQFCVSVPNSVLFDFENKTTALIRRAERILPVYAQTFDDYNKVIQMLVEDGKQGNRSFDTVVFDPITSLIQLVRESLTEKYRNASLLSGPGDITSYGKGGKGWDLINQAVIGILNSLYNAGYGWIVTAHMMPTWKKVGGESDQLIWVSKVNDGVLSFLYKDAEFTGSIERQVALVKEEDSDQPVEAVVAGRKVTLKAKTTKKVSHKYRHVLDMLPHDPKLPTRQHVPLPEEPIEIPAGEGFIAFARTYTQAIVNFKTKEKPE